MDKLFTGLTDLHQHLGSSSTPHFLWELAHEQGIRIREKDYWKFIDSITIKSTTSQANYHHLFDVTQQIQSSPYAVEKAVHNAISYSYRKANVTTIEVKLNPMRRNKGGDHDLDKIILAACVGLRKACLEYPVRAGILIETDRRFPSEYNGILVEKAIKFRSFGVVGIDLSGPENNKFSIGSVSGFYEKARRNGLGLTIHTGETSTTDEVEEVLRKIKPHRIGHGVKIVGSRKLMEIAARNGVVLEVCPSSNLATRIIEDWEGIRETLGILRKNNVLFTINSDCPTLINTNVMKEFMLLTEKGILTAQDVRKIKKTAEKATFIKN